MQPVSEAKRNILLENKQNPCPSTCDALRAAQNKTQQTAFQCAEAHLWTSAGGFSQMQTTEISGACTATGHTAIKTTLLKSKIGDVITDKTKQLEHWVEH